MSLCLWREKVFSRCFFRRHFGSASDVSRCSLCATFNCYFPPLENLYVAKYNMINGRRAFSNAKERTQEREKLVWNTKYELIHRRYSKVGERIKCTFPLGNYITHKCYMQLQSFALATRRKGIRCERKRLRVSDANQNNRVTNKLARTESNTVPWAKERKVSRIGGS